MSGVASPVLRLLDLAVDEVGGTTRSGQQAMADAVGRALDAGQHLLVQAGTGTGKSLAYLVPAVEYAVRTGRPVVVATATVALQGQLVDRDLPLVATAVRDHLERAPTFALLKGRRHYVCRHRLAGGLPGEDESLPGLADPAPGTALGAEVVRLRTWAEATTSGDRDDLVPGVSERAWRQVSVSGAQCLGSRCPVVADCFAEQARERSREVDVVVTNHALVALDAVEPRDLLPEHDVLVVDEGHELVDRVTSATAADLSAATVTAAAALATRAGAPGDELGAAALELATALAALGQEASSLPAELSGPLTRVRDEARRLQSELVGAGEGRQVGEGARHLARTAVDDVHTVAERLLRREDGDVAWLAHETVRGAVLRVAPLSVAQLLRDRVFDRRTVVVTSATLTLGGSFEPVAGNLGLGSEGEPTWRGLDVGSPFDYPRQGIAYVARHLAPPGRDGASPEALDELADLVVAAGGRTLGLFSSMRAARSAADELQRRLAATHASIDVLCQGDDQLPALVRRFAREPATCLFGTLSLWQGVDVPGSSLQLVVVDRIPFPRPDDPLSSARSRAVARAGGNGFMAVSASHAALRLAQGAGRLIRTASDRGVVAFLDSRMMTARYAGFLQRSLPPFWPTTDRDLVMAALRRLDETAPPPDPVTDPVPRAGRPARPGVPPAPDSPRTAVTLGHAWTADRDAVLVAAIREGADVSDIVDRVGLPVEAVAVRSDQLGLLTDPSADDEPADPD